MKKSTRKVIDVTIIAISLSFFAVLALSYYEHTGFLFHNRKAEMFCYAICAFCYLGAFNIVCRHINSLYRQLLFAHVPSLLFTIQIILFNPFLHFLNWYTDRYYFGYGKPVSYGQFFVNDLTYRDGLGEYRYILCEAGMYILCAAVILLRDKIDWSVFQKFTERISSHFEGSSTNTMEILFENYLTGRISSGAIIDYFNSMVCTYSEKMEYKHFLKKYPYKILYEIFLVKFRPLMSRKEYDRYCKLCEGAAEKATEYKSHR